MEDRWTDRCSNRGETHMGRWKVKLGKQKCPACGATIVLIEKRKGWAMIPVHNRPK